MQVGVYQIEVTFHLAVIDASTPETGAWVSWLPLLLGTLFAGGLASLFSLLPSGRAKPSCTLGIAELAAVLFIAGPVVQNRQQTDPAHLGCFYRTWSRVCLLDLDQSGAGGTPEALQ